jgi:two-component system, NtrC family, sensor kinase
MVLRYLPKSSQPTRQRAALSVMLKMVLAVFIAEAMVMVLLMGLPKLPDIVEVFADATLLSVLVAPAMYLLVYKPLYEEIVQRATIESELRNFQEVLKQNAAELEETVLKLQQMPQLIQAEKMTSLERLVAGIAHEINNPITFVQNNLVHVEGYAQDLVDTVKLYRERYPAPDEQIQEWTELIDLDFLKKDLADTIKSIKGGTERVTNIVLALRDFSRLDEADLKVVDIHSGLDSTLLILQHSLHSPLSGSTIQVLKTYGTLSKITCFPRQLNQVFLNLLTNSIDAIKLAYAKGQYSQPGNTAGCITIGTSMVDDQWIKIIIADNGAGIVEKFQKKIFDPFFTTKPIGKGTGMGLSISYQIVVEQHNGRLEYYSKENEGSEFVIYLPVENILEKSR